MPSPRTTARSPSNRRPQTSGKPERRGSQKVKVADTPDPTPTPAQQSKKAGPGVGGGREAARRTNLRAPKVAGAKANPRTRTPIKSDKGADKKRAQRVAEGETVAGSLTAHDAVAEQPRRRGAKKQSRADQAKAKGGRPSAAAAEAAPTQKQILKPSKPKKSRTLRNEGVGNA
jgi:hypothetical protein